MSEPTKREKRKPQESHYLIPLGKDEMNLAEFPFAVLSRKVSSGQKTIEYSDRIEGGQGELVERRWVVTGSDKYGLPVAIDEEVYIGLMALSKENNFERRQVNFTRYGLIKRMGWPVSDGRSYKRIKEALDRLGGVWITAENAFYDSEEKKFVSVGFHIIENYALYEEKPGRGKNQLSLPFSYFRWNEVIWQSLQRGYLKSLDTQFYYTLKTPLSKRLYRFLDKNRFAKQRYDISLAKISNKLPLKDKYPSHIKRTLTPAHQELIERGFLKSVAYRPMVDQSEEKVLYTFSKVDKPSGRPLPKDLTKEADAKLLVEDILALTGDPHSEPFYYKIARLLPADLIWRAISETKAEAQMGTVNSKPKYFTSLITKIAKQQGINL